MGRMGIWKTTKLWTCTYKVGIITTVAWASWHVKLPATWLLVQQFVQADKGEIKAPHHWSLWKDSTCDLRIPFTKSLGGKSHFHVMTSTWFTVLNRRNRTLCMMTSSNGNIFRVTGPVSGEFTGDQWIPLTKASDEELWCFPWSAPEQTV